MPKQTTIAKITRPKTAGVYERKRLFRLIDQARDKAVWISGPAGSGKTTLAASWLDSRKLPCLWYQLDEGDNDIGSFFYYMGIAGKQAAPRVRTSLPLLTPEYAFGVPTFTRRFFETLYSRFSSPFVIVFDNYHHLSEASQLHDLMQIGLSVIPEGVTAIVMSRSDPPPLFTGLRAGKRLAVVGWEELRLSLEETRGVLQLESGKRIPGKQAARVFEKTGGWAAGLVLTAKDPGHAADADIDETRDPEEIFNYFATELFDGESGEVRDFLLRTAVLARMTPAVAGKLAPRSHADRILSDLNHRNLFTAKLDDRGPTYEYHPLFRQFLLARAQSVFSMSELQALRVVAGRCLEQSGQIEDAAELYHAASDAEGLTRLIMHHASALVRQGRHRTLEHWLQGLAPTVRATGPWLQYWMGVCTQPIDPAAARTYFEQAFSLFGGWNDIDAELLAWSAIVETFLYEWNDFTPLDRWIEWFEGKTRRAIAYSSRETEARVALSMAAALMVRNPGHPRAKFWWDRALSHARCTADTGFSLQVMSYAVNYYSWLGDMEQSGAVAGEIAAMAHAPQASPLAQLTWQWLDGTVAAWTLMPAAVVFEKIASALDHADKTGVHVWDHMLYALGMYNALLAEDLDRAREFSKKMSFTLSPGRRHAYCHYHYLIAWERLLAGDSDGAKTNAEKALNLAEETGFQFPRILCSLETARILLARGENAAAHTLGEQAYDAAVETKSRIFQYSAFLLRAETAFAAGSDNQGLQMLREGFSIGKKHGYLSQLWWHHAPALSLLCTRALEAGIEPAYTRTLITKHGLLPENASAAGERWPWPLKIYTLGSFRVERNGEALTFSRRAPRKPLDLLRVLVALGRKNVDLETVMEALWPEAEGDAAEKSLSVTLARLRELLGVKDALVMSEGAISLDERFVWADVRDFEALTEDAQGMSGEIDVACFEQALRLYHGPFFENEDQAWAIRPRERLTSRYLRTVEKLGAHYEKSGNLRKAIDVYQKGMYADDLIEKFHIRVMQCLLELGSKAEALSAYRRLQKTLHAVGVEPSPEAETLHRRILSSGA
jgi:LuxR family maltose regulon positive regulatory protein